MSALLGLDAAGRLHLAPGVSVVLVADRRVRVSDGTRELAFDLGSPVYAAGLGARFAAQLLEAAGAGRGG